MSERLTLYTAFHLNLAYSSIEEEQRAEVVERCYWPLLRLARELGVPLGIEAPAYTLEAAAAIDPAWLDELRSLVNEGVCEFIGSGYAQIIGPLVPAEVNAANLRLGNEAYERLLGIRPRIALVNEQAYSASLVGLYRKAGFRAIVMEWDNPASMHPEWDAEWRYLPQIACGQQGEEIALLWNKSLAFQQFQRYAHGETELEDYLEYLGRHLAHHPRAFPLYGNDVEVFDFRPGRYRTEAALDDGVEWRRIRSLFASLTADPRFEIARPSDVLKLSDTPGADNRLRLESARDPVPVKKQGKYNLTRWAVTPRDDLDINTRCWGAYERLTETGDASDEDWRELCYLWSSDFRTHITDKRWSVYGERLTGFEKRLGVGTGGHAVLARATPGGANQVAGSAEVAPGGNLSASTEGSHVVLRNGITEAVLNARRGLAVERLVFSSVGEEPLVGTLPHGYYEDISLGADFYTGHVVLEPPGAAKIADLDRVRPETRVLTDTAEVSAALQTAPGLIRKRIWLRAGEPALHLEYEFDWDAVPMGSFRVGFVTLIPDAFDRRTLYYACQNGGVSMERFPLAGSAVDHGRPVSSLVSAAGGLGVTGGVVEVGDATRSVQVEVDKACSALIGLMTYREVGQTYFCRLAFSALEMDETCRLGEQVRSPKRIALTLRGARTSARV